MILTPRIVGLIGLIMLVAVVLQAAFFSHLSFLGAAPNILPAVAIALGLLGGAVVGATVGFAVGLLSDALLLQTLGVTSLALILAGYLAGRWREGFHLAHALVAPLLTGALTVVAATAFALIQVMLGVDAAVTFGVVWEIIVQGILAIAIGAAMVPLVSRALGAALIDAGPRRKVEAPQILRPKSTRAGRI